MVVFHAVFIPVVVILAVVGDIMGRINVNLSVKNMGGGIRREDVGDQWTALFAHGSIPLLFGFVFYIIQ